MTGVEQKDEGYFEEIDSSDEEEILNTVGNIPISWYNEFPHIGYTKDGKKIFKPAVGNELEIFLQKMENPDFWKTVKNKYTGEDIVLTKKELMTIKKMMSRNYTSSRSFEPWVDFFTKEVMVHPISNIPPSKKSFIPSLDEKEKVKKLVYAMRMGWIKPNKHNQKDYNSEDEEESENQIMFSQDLWKQSELDENPSRRMLNRISHHIPAPKLPLPSHVESYNPPPEYLFDKDEEEKWTEQDPDERKINFIPKKFPNLRLVPGYEPFLREQYDRCCDLYLCPRLKKAKANVKADDLLPKLPKPSDLRPFPTTLSITYKGHKSAVTTIAIDPISGQYMCSGSKDGTLKYWEISTGRCLKSLPIHTFHQAPRGEELEDHPKVYDELSYVNCVAWCPLTTTSIHQNPSKTSPEGCYRTLAFAAGCYVYVAIAPLSSTLATWRKIMSTFPATPSLVEPRAEDGNSVGNENAEEIDGEELEEKSGGEGDSGDEEENSAESPKSNVIWMKPTLAMRDMGIIHVLKHPHTVKKIEWHRGGDYILTVCPKNGAHSVILNKLSQQHSQAPFQKIKGIIQTAAFHPSAPILFVATQKYVRIYNLVQKELTKILITSCKWISSLAIHPRGDNLIVGTFDNRVVWFDTELAAKPYKILKLGILIAKYILGHSLIFWEDPLDDYLRFHTESVRSVAFHRTYPLFASASEDCTLIISHGMVYKDLAQNPLIVPVKVLKGHQKISGGILDCTFHPNQPWIFSAGADGSIHLYT